jgi:hypothetical protein
VQSAESIVVAAVSQARRRRSTSPIRARRVISRWVAAANVQIEFAKVGRERRDIIVIRCPAYHSPVFLTDSDGKEFHVRAGNTTRLMDVEEATGYIAHHWKQTPLHAPAAVPIGSPA